MKKQETTLQSMVYSLAPERQKELHFAIVDAELVDLNGKKAQLHFSKLAKTSTGKLKKIYTALRKAKNKDLRDAFNVRAEVIK